MRLYQKRPVVSRSECPLCALASALDRLPELATLNVADSAWEGGRAGGYVRSHKDECATKLPDTRSPPLLHRSLFASSGLRFTALGHPNTYWASPLCKGGYAVTGAFARQSSRHLSVVNRVRHRPQ